MRVLEVIAGRPLFLGAVIESLRLGEAMSQANFARKLGISLSFLRDVEKGRKLIGPLLAAQFAKILKRSPKQFVRLSLQEMIDRAGLKMKVEVEAC